MSKTFLRLFLLAAVSVLLTGQAHFDVLAKRAYEDADQVSKGGRAKAAVGSFQDIVRKYPHTVWADRAKMKIAEYYMSQRDYKNAKKELNAHESLYPSSSLGARRDIYEQKVTKYYEDSLETPSEKSASEVAAPFAVHLLRPGMTREEVRGVAGPPDNVYQYSDDLASSEIWYYGEWQVVFGREKYVSHINRKDDRKEVHFGSN